MPDGYRYGRVLLKLSGEALMGDAGYGIDPKVIDSLEEAALDLLPTLRGAFCLTFMGIEVMLCQ